MSSAGYRKFKAKIYFSAIVFIVVCCTAFFMSYYWRLFHYEI